VLLYPWSVIWVRGRAPASTSPVWTHRCASAPRLQVRTLVSQNPSLQRISFIGHSMGGLLCRYAIGVLYCPQSGAVAGLQPHHFVSMATPHCGCDAVGMAQVGEAACVP
jgi:triacylglycerol esterase/lipase EstA (alpha/beta hydrolase family)